MVGFVNGMLLSKLKILCDFGGGGACSRRCCLMFDIFDGVGFYSANGYVLSHYVKVYMDTQYSILNYSIHVPKPFSAKLGEVAKCQRNFNFSFRSLIFTI